METVIYRGDTGTILKYPHHFDIQLVKKRYGHQPAIGENTSNRRRRRKRKLSQRFNKGEEEQAIHFEKICESLLSSFDSLMEIGYKLGYFPIQCESYNSIVSNDIDWVGLCELDKIIPLTGDLSVVKLTQDNSGKDIDVFGKIVCNGCPQSNIQVTVCGGSVIIPSASTFLLSDISKVQLLEQFCAFNGAPYNVIVLDPPWENRSAIRGKKYKWLDKEDIFHLPIPGLLAPGGLVAIWVTNKRELVDWVIRDLLPHWKLQFVGEWTWIKVTTEGDFVFDIYSIHKKPYETLVIARGLHSTSDCEPSLVKLTQSVLSNCIEPTDCIVGDESRDHILTTESTDCIESIQPVITGSEVNAEPVNTSLQTPLPSEYVILCVPSTVHSQKPYLGDLLQYYIEGELKGLEMFARNLLPGWTSWGNEVLLFQVN